MKFWDSSAIVPLLVPEAETPRCRTLIDGDPEVIVWSLTVTEVLSALHRRNRESGYSLDMAALRQRVSDLEKVWFEVVQVEATRLKAHRLLAVHPLRAADAMQLAAALVVFEDRPEGQDLVTLDAVLAEAARREGFRILP